MPQCIKQIYETGGVWAFYRSSLWFVGSQVLSTSSKYVLYKHFEERNNPNKLMGQRVKNGIIGGVLSSLITHPVDFFKVHAQMGHPISRIVRNIYMEGVTTMYRGYTKSFAKVLVSTSIFFPVYDMLLDSVRFTPFQASSLTGILGTVCMHPFDYIKVRHIYNLPLFQGFSPRPYFRGLGLHLARVVPHFAITMTVLQHLKDSKAC